MRNILILFKREMKSYFTSPIAYVVAFVFLILSGHFFVSFLKRWGVAEVGYMVGDLTILSLFLSPILTIKLFSEEKRSGTLELLLTSPVTSLELVIGKFLAAFTLYTLILLPTLIYVFIMGYYSSVGPDYGVAFTAYLGLLLFTGSLVAIGIFTSALTQSQVIAAITGFGISLFFLLIHSFTQGLESSLTASIMQELSLMLHFKDFGRGILNIADVIYYLFWIFLFLVLGNKAVESHAWK